MFGSFRRAPILKKKCVGDRVKIRCSGCIGESQNTEIDVFEVSESQNHVKTDVLEVSEDKHIVKQRYFTSCNHKVSIICPAQSSSREAHFSACSDKARQRVSNNEALSR